MNGKTELFPTIITADAFQDTINSFKQQQINLPVPRFCEGGSKKSWVTEICKVQMVYGNTASWEMLTKQNFSWRSQLSTTSQSAITQFDPTVFYSQSDRSSGITTATGSSANTFDLAKSRDMGCAGNGILVATDRIFLGLDSAGFTGTQLINVTAKIWLRLKQVPLQDYILIVQGQQGNG